MNGGGPVRKDGLDRLRGEKRFSTGKGRSDEKRILKPKALTAEGPNKSKACKGKVPVSR